MAPLSFSLSRLSGGPGAALPVLMYHRVLERQDPLQDEIHVAHHMDHQFSVLRRYFKVLPLDEATAMLAEDRLPPRAVCLTFDDGYRDNHDVALPLLQRHGLTATFYIASGFLNGGIMFHDVMVETIRHAETGTLDLGLPDTAPFRLSDIHSRVHAIIKLTRTVKYLDAPQRQALSERLREALGPNAPRQLMMDDEQVRRLARAGMSVGGHTTQHQILAKLSDDRARDEIESNRQALSSLVDAPLTSFAYPNGKPGIDYGEQHIRMVREAGFRTAVSTRVGLGTRQANPLELPRFVLNETSTLGIVTRMLRMTAYPVSA